MRSSGGGGDTRVLDEGGASGRSATVMGESGAEWSATGLPGTALGDLTSGAADGVTFAAARAESRLVEMQGSTYIARAMRQKQKKTKKKSDE